MKKLLFFVLTFAIHFTASAADSFSTLEERMSGKEFMETGLAKLTDEELKALNDWVRSHSVATLENARPQSATSASAGRDMRGFENKSKDRDNDDTIHSTIVGPFNGWKDNGTLFKLGNGMIWKQVESGSLYVRTAENVAITIKSGFMGSWRLKVDGYNESVRVERIQ